MTKIVIIGTGNVARHLFDAFQQHSSVAVVQVLGRNTTALRYFKAAPESGTELAKIAQADIYIIAVSDDAIYAVCEELKLSDKLVVHCSGSLEMTALPTSIRRGVFYPVQTFSRGRKVDFREVPICIEAENKRDLAVLKALATILSSHVYEVNSQQRSQVHLAAVFVNNFTNYLYGVGAEICRENGLPFEILQPLIQETAAKIQEVPPIAAQTGPARRGDKGTITKHLGLLQQKNHGEIYSLLSRAIEDACTDQKGMVPR